MISYRSGISAQDHASSTAADRRGAARHPCQREAVCHVGMPGKGAFCLGRIVDISAGGIGLILQEGFLVGTRLVVKLINKALSRPLQIQVIHVSEVTPGYYLLGGVLNSQLEAEELQALLQ